MRPDYPSPGSQWGLTTPQLERDYEQEQNLPSGSCWPGIGGEPCSLRRDYYEEGPGCSPIGFAYDPPSCDYREGECTGCDEYAPYARSLDNGDPYCKLCWYAYEQGVKDASMYHRLRYNRARNDRMNKTFDRRLQAEERSGLRAADAARAILTGVDTPPIDATRPIARVKRGHPGTLLVDLLSGTMKRRKQRAEELAEYSDSREELRRHGEMVAAMEVRGGALSRNDRAVIRLVRLLL